MKIFGKIINAIKDALITASKFIDEMGRKSCLREIAKEVELTGIPYSPNESENDAFIRFMLAEDIKRSRIKKKFKAFIKKLGKYLKFFIEGIKSLYNILSNYCEEKRLDRIYYWKIQLGTMGELSFNFEKLKAELADIISLFDSAEIRPVINGNHLNNYILHVYGYKDRTKQEIVDFVQHKMQEIVLDYFVYWNVSLEYKPSQFVFVDFDDKNSELHIFLAEDPRGITEIEGRKQRANSILNEAKKDFKVSYQKGIHTPAGKIAWGYALKNTLKALLPISTHCHALITGSSGSGKSTAVIGLLANFLSATPTSKIYILDFKAGSDWKFLCDYPNYFSAERCLDGLRKYYQHFKTVDDDGNKSNLLIFDEYPAFITYLTMQDKINKTKFSYEAQSMMTEILAMGRSKSCGVWIIAQRPDASLFPNGSRDNFMVCLALGNLSKEHKTMMFSGNDIPDSVYAVGEGLLLADGKPLLEVKFPILDDISSWKYHIFRLLMEDYLEDVADIGE